MTFRTLIAVLFLFLSSQAAGQAATPQPCSQPEASQFDFWLGEWELEWADGGRGRNEITKALDDCVIVENFDGTPSIRLRGMSISTYNARIGGKWQQTWVDNQGGYLDFSGGFADGRMVLQRAAAVDGNTFLQRMVWYDIADDSLRWNWERSDDGGETWNVLWEIRYRRAETAAETGAAAPGGGLVDGWNAPLPRSARTDRPRIQRLTIRPAAHRRADGAFRVRLQVLDPGDGSYPILRVAAMTKHGRSCSDRASITV